LGNFKLAKTPLGKSQYSSAHKLPIGKLDPRILKVSINSGKGICLHDAAYSKTAANPEQGKTIELNITSTAVTDKSGNSNHPTLNNVSLLNGEMQFNGNGICTLPNSPSYKTNPFSFFMRVKTTSLASSQVIFDFGNSYIYITTGGGIAVVPNGWLFTSSTNLAANSVYDIVLTFESYVGSGLGRISIYVNGVFDSAKELSSALIPAQVAIGARINGSNPMNGSIYAFRMYDYALSPAEVKALSPSKEISVIDDNQASYWSTYENGSGTKSVTLSNDASEKASGANSLKVTFSAGSWSYVGFQKD
jgi:hypothetical protein